MKGAAPVPEPNVFLTGRCNRRCVYCSAEGEEREMTRAEAEAVLAAGHGSLVFEGGEPLLRPDLENWVARAVRKGVSDISVLTNGSLLTPARRASLAAAGVKHFHFNFPAHTAREHAFLTGSPGALAAQARAIAETAASGPEAAVLVCVVNSVNCALLPAYVAFAARNFPGLFYIAFNFVKVKGLVKSRLSLVPPLPRAAPFLRGALAAAKKAGIPCLVDGFPLCFLRGFEAYSRDAWSLLNGDRTYLREKSPVAACARCTLSGICAGPRRDYLALYGNRGFRPSRLDPAPVARKVLQGQLSLNRISSRPVPRRKK